MSAPAFSLVAAAKAASRSPGCSHSERLKLHAQRRCRLLEPLQRVGPDRIVGIPEDGHPGDPGGDLLQQLQILQLQLVGEDREAGEIAARPCQTRDQTGLDRVATDAHDGDRARGLLGRHERRRGPSDDDVDLPTDKVCKESGMLLRRASTPVLDDDVLSLDIPVIAQTLPECLRLVDSRSVGYGWRNPIRYTFPAGCASAASGAARRPTATGRQAPARHGFMV